MHNDVSSHGPQVVLFRPSISVVSGTQVAALMRTASA